MDKLLSFLEKFGAITGLAGVWLSTKQKVWCWPLLILSSIAYGIVFFNKALYADGALQIVYIGMLLYGWNSWLSKSKQKIQLIPSYSRAKELGILLFLYGVVTFLLAAFLKEYTEDPLPYLDSFTFVGSITAQYLQARKKIENWLVWLAVNTVYIYMYFDRALDYTMILFAIFWVMSIIGWMSWRKQVVTEIRS